jgi:uncharacterized membrane protein
MADIEKFLNRWQSGGVLDAQAAARIRAWENEQRRPAPSLRSGAALAWQGVVALILGGILLATGVILFISAHWDNFGPWLRFCLVLSLVALFHLAGAVLRDRSFGFSTALHAAGTIATCAAIVVTANIFSVQDHWPAAVLMFAVSAFAGWALLRDQAHQAMTLLLFPSWIFFEISYYTQGCIGQAPYLGRFLFVWAIFCFTMLPASGRKAVHWILFAAAAIAVVAGVSLINVAWYSWSSSQKFIPFSTCFWAWAAIAALPLAIAAFKGHWGLIPPASAIVVAVALPWCQHVEIVRYAGGTGTYTHSEPNLVAHALSAAFAVFVILWGMRQASRALVNLGIGYFALVVAWFYFSSIYGKLGRALGLIGLGLLFLLGGWALELTRRRLLARMQQPRPAAVPEAQ